MSQDLERNKKPLDVVEAFHKDKVDLAPIIKARKRVHRSSRLSLSPYTGTWGKEEKKHLLNRALLGLSQRHFSDIENLSLAETLELLFTPEPLDEPVNNYFNFFTPEEYRQKYGVDDVPPGAPFINNASTEWNDNGEYENGDWIRRQAIHSWIMKRMYFQNTSIHWKMFFFLHNLIPTDGGQGPDNKGLYSYYKLLFESVFGSYKDTIYNITVNPAMLVYLNLGLSRKETPDENYAREIQELFTVGKRPVAQFTESDVREMARLLVGWYVNYDSIFEPGPITSGFDPENHDTGDKQFSAFYGNRLIRGRSGPDAGSTELNEMLDMIFDAGQAAIYLSRRLYQFFVYPDVTDAIEQNIILPLAEVMKQNNFNLAATLKVLLRSEHFFDQTYYNAMIKSPLEFVFSITKEFDLFNGRLISYEAEPGSEYNIPEKFTDPLSRSFYFFRNSRWSMGNQGLSLAEPPSVSGWPAYYQSPVYDMFWINSMSAKNRGMLTDSFSQWGYWLDEGVHVVLDHIAYLMTYENHENLSLLLDEMTERFLGAPIPEQGRDRIIRTIIGSLNESYWTEVVQNYKNDPNAQNQENLTWRIKSLLKQIFLLGETHLF